MFTIHCKYPIFVIILLMSICRSSLLVWVSIKYNKGVKLKNFYKIINNETPEFLRSLLPKRIGDVRPQSRNPDNYYNVNAIMLKPGQKHSGLVLFLPQSNYGIPLMSVTEL